MKQITLTPETPWKDALKAAKAEIQAAGGVVLVAKTPRARRHLMKVYREFRFPRRHDPESSPDTWPLRGDEIDPRIFVDLETVDRIIDLETGEDEADPATGDWHLLLSIPNTHEVALDERGVPITA